MTRKHRGKSGLQPTVLLVEPRAEELEKTRALLGEAGFRVVPLTRFEAVVPIFEVVRPDAVVLAVHSPDFAAVAVVRRLRQLGEVTVPLFYLMDPDQPEAWRFCLEKGLGVDMVPRNLSGSELALRLQSVLRLRDAVLRAKESGETEAGSALHDELTGVYNKQFLLAMIGQEARRSERYGGPFSVLACAPQGYRSFCKQHGEAMGERLLVYTAVVLGQTVRESDVVARVSDEEFALLLPAMEEDALPGLLARIATRFELARFQVEGKALKTSLLLGAVSFPDMVGTPAQLLNGAIQEMRRRSREARRWDVGMSRVSV